MTTQHASHILLVNSFEELISLPYHGQVNALCLQRELEGDFEEIVRNLNLLEDITEISMDHLNDLNLSHVGQIARQCIINDWKLLKETGAQPVLNLLKCYSRDDEFDFIATDVYSFHVDRSTVPTSTFLCTYYGASSDIIANEEVEQKILIPEIREKLRALHDGTDETFEDFLKEYYFDLHYQPKPHAIPTNLGKGNVWRLAVDHPQQVVPPCVHRAPTENKNEYRLLLIC